MSHTIADKSKLKVHAVNGDLATIDANIQSALQGSTFANGDKIIDISIVKNNHSNLLVAYITYEDQ